MPTTPTTTTVLIDLVLAELAAHLPTKLSGAGLPAVAEFCFGQRELVPATRTPQVQVALSDYTQSGRFGGDMKRFTRLTIIAVLSAANEDALQRALVGYGDCLCAVVEAEITPNLQVTNVDASPSFGIRGQNNLFAAVAIEAEPMGAIHHAGNA